MMVINLKVVNSAFILIVLFPETAFRREDGNDGPSV